MTNRQRGKNTERAIAKRIRGRRVGILGHEDVQHELWSVEVKSRVKFSGEGFMQQAVKNCPQGKTPIVVVHIHGRQHSNDLVIIRMKDFEAYLGSLSERREDHEQ